MNVPSAIILYTTRTNNTRDIAEYIAEGIRFSGFKAVVKNIQELSDPAELQAYDAVVLGSATYNSGIMEEMKEFFETLRGVNLEGKKGGAFGAYGWSGEAPDEIYKFMKDELRITLPADSLRLRDPNMGGGVRMAQDYGREIAKIMQH